MTCPEFGETQPRVSPSGQSSGILPAIAAAVALLCKIGLSAYLCFIASAGVYTLIAACPLMVLAVALIEAAEARILSGRSEWRDGLDILFRSAGFTLTAAAVAAVVGGVLMGGFLASLD